MQIINDIIEKYDDMIRCYALSIAKNESLADDIVQDCYLKVINNSLMLERLKSSQVRSWLFTVVKNILIDKKRKKQVQNVAYEIQLKARSNPELEVQVEKLLDKLESQERKIVYCKYWLGMNSKEISRELEIPSSTVRWKLTSALKRLKKFTGDSLWNTVY